MKTFFVKWIKTFVPHPLYTPTVSLSQNSMVFTKICAACYAEIYMTFRTLKFSPLFTVLSFTPLWIWNVNQNRPVIVAMISIIIRNIISAQWPVYRLESGNFIIHFSTSFHQWKTDFSKKIDNDVITYKLLVYDPGF